MAKVQDMSGSSRVREPFINILRGDARRIDLPDNSVDVVVTSPPYWKKRDYRHKNQIGQEETPQKFAEAILECLREWRRVLRPTASVFLNIGDTYWRQSLAGVPGRVEALAIDHGWKVRNRLIWTKEGGMPEPARNRLANRHEYVIHLTPSRTYYYDLYGYAEIYGNGANPGDVWSVGLGRNMSRHLAPFPAELVERAVHLACPTSVCTACGTPRERITERTAELDPSRPQARRAMELARQHRLTAEHIAAIQATGVSDAGKALLFQNGTGRNSAEVRRLAAEAKAVLGGYFREFTFAKRKTVGWTECACGAPTAPGVLLDPFMGTGTALKAAYALGRSAIGVDLVITPESKALERGAESESEDEAVA